MDGPLSKFGAIYGHLGHRVSTRGGVFGYQDGRHQLSGYGPSSLRMGIYIGMALISKYGGNIWNIFTNP